MGDTVVSQEKPSERRLALQAYEQLMNMILSGALPAGTVIRERQLAERLEMSRTPLRDALSMLESEQLLVRHERRVLQVKPMDVREFIDNIAIRQLLEPEAARLAAGRVAPGVLEGLRQRILALIAAPAHGGVDRSELRAVDSDLHGAIGEAAGNPQLWRIVQGLRLRTVVFDLKSLPERFPESCREHLELIALLEAAESEKAARAMFDHLENVRTSIIARLTSGSPRRRDA
jgi:DNA-binding GntR family transcriptional regulator